MPIPRSLSVACSTLPILAALAAPPAATGACGAHYCPRISGPAPSSWEAGWVVQRLTFDIAGVAGAYSEALLSARWIRSDRIVAAVHVPYLALETPQGDRTGFGNPMVLAEYRWRPAPQLSLSLGSQLEFPLGDHEHGLAQPHYMAVPYGTGAFTSGIWSLAATGGLSFNFGGHHETGTVAGSHHNHAAGNGAATAIFVHPHEDLEAVYRLSAGAAPGGWIARFETFLGGQHVLGAVDGPGEFLTAGFSVPVAIGRFEIAPETEFPLTAARRFEWALGLRCNLQI